MKVVKELERVSSGFGRRSVSTTFPSRIVTQPICSPVFAKEVSERSVLLDSDLKVQRCVYSAVHTTTRSISVQLRVKDDKRE